MKSFIIVSVVLALVAFAAGNPQDPCFGVLDGIFVNNPESCSAYFSCLGGIGTPGSCPSQYYFNFEKQTCDWPVNVACVTTTPHSTETVSNTSPISTEALTESTETEKETTSAPQTTSEVQTEEPIITTTEEPTESTPDETDEETTEAVVEITTEAVTEAPSVCYGLTNGILVESTGNCERFFHCVDNLAFINSCPPGLLFNGVYCDFEDRVSCLDDTTTTVSEEETTTEAEIEGPVDPDAICFGKPDYSFVNNLESCPAFYYCLGDLAFPGLCPKPFYFNPVNGICDWPHEVDCSDETAPTTTTENPEPTETPTEVPETDTQNPETEEPSTVTETLTTEPSVPEPEPICLPGEVGLQPHTSNCTLYLLCFNGDLFELSCNPDEHFSAEINGCVPREQANCRLEDPVCDPIESENRAIYSPHPHFCDQFFVCFRGDLLRLSCSTGDHWNKDKNSCVTASESQCIE